MRKIFCTLRLEFDADWKSAVPGVFATRAVMSQLVTLVNLAGESQKKFNHGWTQIDTDEKSFLRWDLSFMPIEKALNQRWTVIGTDEKNLLYVDAWVWCRLKIGGPRGMVGSLRECRAKTILDRRLIRWLILSAGAQRLASGFLRVLVSLYCTSRDFKRMD